MSRISQSPWSVSKPGAWLGLVFATLVLFGCGGGGGASTQASISATALTTAQSLTVGTAMTSFSPLTPSAGAAPYTYIVTSGSLPTGLSLNASTGAVTGTPSAIYASANVVFSVHDTNGVVANTTSSVSFSVGAASVSISATTTTTAQSLTVGTAMASFSPLTPSGGVSPYTYSVTSGALPAGLSLDASTGAVTGTPSAIYAIANVVFSVRDANGVAASATSSVNFTVVVAPVSISATATTTAQSLTVGTAVASFMPLTPSGGVAPYTYIITSGTLPAGLSLGTSTGAVTGTPTATYAAANVVFAVHDANGVVANTSSSVSFAVGAATVAISATANQAAQSLTVGRAMTSFTPLTASGGTPPYTYSVSSGTLPAGLQLGMNTGAVTGTPTASYASANVVFSVKGANSVVAGTTSSVSFVVVAAPVSISATATTTAQSLTVGTAMASLSPLTPSGGVAPYTYLITSGSLPAGLSLGTSTGAVTGTPTATYAAANVVFAVHDANGVVANTSSSVSFTVGAATVAISATANQTARSLTVGTAMTSFTPLTASGGVAPYTYSVISGTLPAGLQLGMNTGAVTGTPTASYASANVVFSVHDANGAVANTTSSVSFAVVAAPVSISATATTTAQSLTVGTAMASLSPLTPSGGVAPYTYLITSGTLPAGLSLGTSTGAVTGTPTTTYAAANVVFSVHDANGVVANTTSSVSFSVGAAAVSISATANQTAQSLTVGTAMASFTPLTASGGVAPYTYSVISGTLPAGLQLGVNTGAVTGTPTASYATSSVVFSVKGANNVAAGTTSSVNFTVIAAPVSISATATTTAQSLTVGTAMASFSPLTPSGGVAPYIFSYAGTLPAGLSLNASTGAVSGTPTTTYAATNLVFSVQDAKGVLANTTSTVSFSVGAAAVAISATANQTAQSLTVGTAMTGFSPLSASGGVAPYNYSVAAGALPAGLQLGVNTGAVTGTPTASYTTANVVFSVRDANNVAAVTTSTVSFTVVAAPVSISATATTTAQSLTVGTAMASFSPLTPSGGVAPYAYLITSGTLPAGLSLNTSTGAVTGTPSATYATANVVFAVQDANGVVASTTSNVNFTVAAVSTVITATANPTNQPPYTHALSGAIAMASFSPLTVSGGTPPYTYSVTQNPNYLNPTTPSALPPGLSFNTSTGVVTGTPSVMAGTTPGLWYALFSVMDANNVVASVTKPNVTAVYNYNDVNFKVLPARRLYPNPVTGTVGGVLVPSTWWPSASNETYTYAEAVTLCSGTINGLTGWRMPTVTEMQLLFDYYGTTLVGLPAYGWFLGTTWGTGVGNAGAARPPAPAGSAYAVNLAGGNGPVSLFADTTRLLATCVR